MRQTVYHIDDITVIDDSYNASPDSVKSGIDVLCSLPNQGEKNSCFGGYDGIGRYERTSTF